MAKHIKEQHTPKRPWLRLFVRQLQFVLDTATLSSAFLLAYLLRFDFSFPEEETRAILLQLPYVVALQCAALMLTGIHSFIWRYVGMGEIKSFTKAALMSAIPLFLLRIGLPEQLQVWRVPLSIIVVDTILAFGGILGLRVLRRAWDEGFAKRHRVRSNNGNGHHHAKPVLLIGAGRAGMLTAREIQSRGNMNLDVKGFVDDDAHKQGSVIQQLKVLGTTRDIPRLVHELGIDHVVVTIVEASRRDFRRILNICKQVPVKVRTIPGLYEILLGDVKVSRIRDIQIEDLLGREPVCLDETSMKEFLAGKSVMVTGAGGSIGSELTRQIARLQPAQLLLVERAEGALFFIDRELREKWPALSVTALVGDVGDEIRMQAIFERYQPQVVLHAAAHKHVPMMESNVTEAVKNNILATRLLAEMSGQFGVESFVLISTDKAVRPSSVMGATKRMAELVVQNLNGRFQTRFVAVRFGNVIGSAGSVIPIFREQISRGGPITVTHPDMVRYFMTIPEAAQLVLQAGALGAGGEIFILDMGEPVRILDLAMETITLSGLRPFIDIEILFTGMRPGEKLFEELDAKGEKVAKTRHPKIFIGQIATYPEEKVRETLKWLETLARADQAQRLRRILNDLLFDAQLEVESAEDLISIEHTAPHQLVAGTTA
jgi:FlaA1/EpsC-like NDP-sugar epimerase